MAAVLALALPACTDDAAERDAPTGPSFVVLAAPPGQPIPIKGTPSCADLNADNTRFPTVTSSFGFLIDKMSTGGYTVRMIDSLPYTQMTGGAPPNTFGKVTIKVTKPGLQFDWSATLGIDAVIVKVKDSSNVYVYSPEAYGAQALQARRLADTVKIEFCHDYELTSTKTANTAYTRTYSWTISKTVDDGSHAGYPGMSFKPTYTVSVDQTVMESDFLVSGKITVTNPTLWGPVTFTPSDVVGSTPVSVKCDTYTIAAGKTATCLYSAGLSGKDDGTNTATITSSHAFIGGTTASANYTFTNPTKTVGTASVTVRDDVQGYLGTASQDKTFPQYSGRFACSTSGADYTNGVDEDTYTNTSSIDETQQTASASVTVTCEAAFVDLLKWTDGVVNPDRGWAFTLHPGPDGFGSKPMGGGNTYGDSDGILEFGGRALDPTKTHTVCEHEIPAGFTSTWDVDADGDGTFDAKVIPYNPNANDVPPADLGNRCIDFGAGTTIPLTVGATIRFRVDNTHPGGDPRSPGYWKNWNTCTAGGQADNAARNGGYDNGFWLIGDVLDPSIGGGIVWDDIQADEKVVTITSCLQAVAILDQRVVTADGRGKKLANDAARTLAMQLLAAQLNLAAGACTGGQGVRDALLAAELLLDGIDFDGTKASAYLTSKSGQDYGDALRLATILDGYNHGLYCGSLK